MPAMIDELLEATPMPIGPFFRFPNETVGMDALRSAGFIATDEEGNESVITASHIHCLDVIGTITRGGEWDDEGNVITPPTVLDGWHINFQGDLPEGWEQYAVHPQQPVRVWA